MAGRARRGKGRLPRLQANNRQPRHAEGKLGTLRQHTRHRHLHLLPLNGPPAAGQALRRRRQAKQDKGVDILGTRRLVRRPAYAPAMVRGRHARRPAAAHGLLPVVQAHPPAPSGRQGLNAARKPAGTQIQKRADFKTGRFALRNGPFCSLKRAVSEAKTTRFHNALSVNQLDNKPKSSGFGSCF